MELTNELKMAVRLAERAGEEILEIYNGTFTVKYKEDHSPLTDADKVSNKIIVSELKNNFPKYAILSEEGQDDLSRLKNDWCWIVDPLDGTREFVKHNGEFTVNIGLVYKQKTVLGVIYLPVTGELYYASKGNGAYYSNKNSTKAVQIHVTDKVEYIRLVMSRSHASQSLKDLIVKRGIKNVVKAGSSLKGALVARGEAEVYYRFNPTMEWDTAAMQCIVEESGGIFRQMDGSEMTYNRKNSLNDKGFYIVNRKENLLV